ncbi:MAG TPA: hypothetical protein VIL30_16540 [Ramlibacter sp.]|jgi:hypothetical protein
MSLRTLLAATATLPLSLAAHAHGGHHAPEVHWHASDAWGFVVLGALAALAIWLSRRG